MSNHSKPSAINPEDANAQKSFGIVFATQNRLPEAIACFRRSLALNPKQADVLGHLAALLNNQAGSFLQNGQTSEAVECLRESLRINSRQADVHYNLGNVLFGIGEFSAAAACYERTLAFDPDHHLAQFDQALLRLLHGDFEGGWAGFEKRLHLPGVTNRTLEQPLWDGSAFAGKTLLVTPDTCLGDTLQMCRCLPFLKARGGTVVFECIPALCSFLAGIPGVDQIIAAGTPMPRFDVHIPLLSLPGVFRTTLGTIPPPLKIAPDPNRVEHWRDELWRAARPAGKELNLGIVWQGGTNSTRDPRSAPLCHFEPLAKAKGVRLVSLQVGPGTGQLAAATFPVLDLGNRFDPQSMEDIAAALMNLDLVVTIDTSVAHLAGTLGVPVWVALPFVASWFYGLERSDCPWYPSMRLFRQRKPGDWGELFEQVAAALPLP